MKILVTGGAGFVGSALCRRLALQDHEVTVFDNFSRGDASRLHGTNVRVVYGDVRSPGQLANAVWGQDFVCHLAYLQGTQTFYSNPREVLHVGVQGMLNLLDCCQQAGVTGLLLVSSSEAYQVPTEVPTTEAVPLSVPDPTNPRYSYGGGKIISELMTLAWARDGLLDRAIIARPHNIIGPDMGREHVLPEFCIRMNRLAREQPEGVIEFPIQGTGLETRSFCWVGDCSDQLAFLVEHGETQNVYHVGTMDERTIAELASEVARCYKREIKVRPGALPQGSPPRRLPDTAKIEALGQGILSDRVPFAEAVRLTTEWYQQHG